MRIAITGGSGFIGSAVAERLRRQGHSVKSTDVRGADPQYIRNVLKAEDCERICRGADVVIHGAAIHNASETKARPTAMIELNIEGTANMLIAAVAEGVRRFIYLSSGKIYGDTAHQASRESDLPRPKEHYALSKLAGEHYLESFQRKHDLDCVAIRPFSVYGPGQDLNTGYIGMLMQGMLDGNPVHIPGEGEYLRDFVHIRDVARLCALAAAAELPPFTVLNAGTGQATRLEDLKEAIGGLGESKVHVHYRTPEPGTLSRSFGDMELALQELGFQPEIELTTGLAETIQWLRAETGRQRRAGT